MKSTCRAHQAYIAGLDYLIEQLRLAKSLAQLRIHNEGPSQPEPSNLEQSLFDRLPDELISKIFLETLYLHLHTPNLYEAFGLAHVNRRFMKVAYSTTNLWNTITQLRHPEMIKVALERSGNRPLHVVEAACDDDPQDEPIQGSMFAQCLQLILTHGSRLRTLNLANCNTLYSSIAYQMVIKPTWLRLPALEALDMQCPFIDDFWTAWEHEAGNPEFRNILPECRFPVLRSIRIPDYMYDVCVSEHLTSFSLVGRMHSRADDMTYIAVDLLGIMIQMPRMEHFSMEMDYPEELGAHYIQAVNLVGPASFVCGALKTFTFRAKATWTHKFLATVFTHGQFPELESLTLDLSVGFGAQHGDGGVNTMALVTRALASREQTFNKLRQLSLSRAMQGSRRVDRTPVHHKDATAFDLDMLQNMPGLQDVSLYYTMPQKTLVEGLGASERYGASSASCILPELEKVSLYDNPLIYGYHVEAMVNSRIKHSGVARPLQYLRVQGCKHCQLFVPLDVAQLHIY